VGEPVATVVGTMTASFTDPKHATLAYSVNGTSQTKSRVPQEPRRRFQAFDNVEAAAPEFTQEGLGELESASALPPEYPA